MSSVQYGVSTFPQNRTAPHGSLGTSLHRLILGFVGVFYDVKTVPGRPSLRLINSIKIYPLLTSKTQSARSLTFLKNSEQVQASAM